MDSGARCLSLNLDSTTSWLFTLDMLLNLPAPVSPSAVRRIKGGGTVCEALRTASGEINNISKIKTWPQQMGRDRTQFFR